jgi:hypothetical protein
MQRTPTPVAQADRRQKTERLIADLRQRGVSPYTTAPPLFRLAWALGLNVPPPFLMGFLPLTLLMGAFYGTCWDGFIWALQCHSGPPAQRAAATLAVCAGLVFGLSVAAYYRRKASRLPLPSRRLPRTASSRRGVQIGRTSW